MLVPAEALSWRLARAAVWSCAGAAFLRAFNFAAWVFCARYLGKVAFGEFSMVMSTAGALGVLAAMGLGVTVTRHTAEYRGGDASRAGRVIGLTFLLVSLAGVLIASLMVVLAPLIATHLLLAPQIGPALQVSALLVLLNALNAWQTGALAGFEAFRQLAFANLCSGLASFPIIASSALHGGLEGAVWGLAAAQSLSCVLNQIVLRRECARNGVRCSLSGCWRETAVVWRSALPALLSSALLLPALWCCSTSLARQPGGFAQLGLYAAADRWRLLILFVPGSLAGTALPILSNLRGSGDTSGFRDIFRTNALLNALFAVVPGFAVAVLAQPLLSVFGHSYPAGWPVLAVLAFAASSEAMNTALGQAVVAESMWRRFAFDALLVAILGCAAWLLVPRWGALGLSLAYLLAYTTVAITLFHYTRDRAANDGGSLACLES